MNFNPEVIDILREAKINKSQGLLCLLAIHFDLEADTIINEEVMKTINMTHIVEKDYNTNQLKWTIPLFENGEAGAFEWVTDWVKPFKDIGGPARAGVKKEIVARMKEFFTKNPEYRKEDVFKARDLYFTTVKPRGEMVKSPHKFIYEGMGLAKTSMLLLWCEKVKEANFNGGDNQFMRGKIVT